MSETTQNFSNHTRFHPPFHFVMAPLLIMHLIWSGILVYRNPGWLSIEGLLFAIGVFLAGFLARVNPLRAQDRLIRLEEQLRYQRVLGADLAAKAANIEVAKIVALRFASDGELADLVKQTLDGKLAKPADIKKAIKNWRGDYFRV